MGTNWNMACFHLVDKICRHFAYLGFKDVFEWKGDTDVGTVLKFVKALKEKGKMCGNKIFLR